MKKITVIALLLIQTALSQAGNEWITYFEKSEFTSTPDYQETMDYFQSLADFSNYAELNNFGISIISSDF